MFFGFLFVRSFTFNELLWGIDVTSHCVTAKICLSAAIKIFNKVLFQFMREKTNLSLFPVIV